MRQRGCRIWVIALSTFAVAAGTLTAASASDAADDPGLTIVLTPSGRYTRADLDRAASVIRRRVDLRPGDASVRRRGADIVIHLPGVDDTEVSKLLVEPPVLQFRPVLVDGLPPENVAGGTSDAAVTTVASCDPDAVVALDAVPTTAPQDDDPRACVVLPERPSGNDAKRYYLGPSALDGTSVAHAKAQFVPGQGWTVRLDFTKPGGQKFDSLARQQFHRQVAMTLDGFVESAPLLQPGEIEFSSYEGTAVISGAFKEREARDLATLTNIGPLPVRLTVKSATLD